MKILKEKETTKDKLNSKKGISLIVLVITIIVIIILAAAVILTLTNNNPIENAKQAAYVNDLASFQDELDMYKANEYAKNLGDFDPATLNASSTTNSTLLYACIPSLEGKTKYTSEIAISEGQLIYTGPAESIHKTWAAMANISDGTAPVVTDTTAPTVTFGTNGGTNATQVTTTVAVTDAGGVNASTLQYVWDTQNTIEPTSGWNVFATGDTLSKTGTGIYYLWIKASDTTGNNVVTKSNAFGLGVEEIPVGTIQTEHKTFAGTTTGFSYNNPVIPSGFVAVNTTTASWNNLGTDWDKGLVIQDASANQFVWVPVDGTDVKYEKIFTYPSYDGTSQSDLTNDTLPTGVTNEISQINTYKGFYISRYEAGNLSNTVVSKKGVPVWNNIQYINAKSTAQNMYTNTNLKSGIITGTMWDTTMKWFSNASINVLNSSSWGNHYEAVSPANVSGYSTLQNTGYSEYWKAKNIYDLAGNTWEFTNERGLNNCPVYRGGDYRYNSQGYSKIVSVRGAGFTDTSPDIGLSFRIALYII